jgi:YD repeat-containing protein
MKYHASRLARLLCSALACALVAPPQLAAAGQSITPHGIAPAMRVMRQSAPPASDLPDLNAIHQLQSADPVAPPAIPSTACSPLNPGCQGGSGILRSPFLDPRQLSAQSYQLASNLGVPTLGSLRSTTELAVTDAATAPLLAPTRKSTTPATANAITASALMQSQSNDRSVALDGMTGRVSMPYSSSLDIAGPYTVETWFKISDNDQMQYLVSCGTTTGGFVLIANDGMPALYQTNAAGQSDYAMAWPPNITFGTWHHMAGVFDGSQIRVYLDGSLIASKSTTVVPGSFSGSTLAVGGFQGGATTTMVNGLVDEVRLSAGALYTSNFTPQRHLTSAASTRGLWKFDGQTLQDSSGNNNNSTFVGGAAYASDNPDYTGAVDNSASFDGSTARISVPYNSTLDITGPYTVETWFKITDDDQMKYLVSTGTTTGGFVLLANDGAPGLYQTNSAGVGDFAIAPQGAIFGAWHHMAGVFDGTQIRVYLDGTLVAAKNTSVTPGSFAGSTLSIGGYQGGNVPTLINGLMDEVRLSSGALYTANFTPQRHLARLASTRGLWKFDGQTLLDLSGGGNNGSFVGSATYSSDVSDVANQPPTVSITSPAVGATFANDSTINISADSSDLDGTVSKVEFFVNGTKLGEDATAPYAFAWDHAGAGSYSITARATDNAGTVTASSPVSITVTQPSVSVVATDSAASEQGPDGGTFAITRTGGTSQPLVVAYALSGTATNGSDYTTRTGSLTIPAGASSQTITVTPVDDTAVEGDENVIVTLSTNSAYAIGSPASATVTITDNDTYPPTATITAPTAGTVVTAPAAITITATATDPDGTVAKVEFFQNGAKLGEDTTAPYSFTWSNVAAGSYSLTAVATDNAGATGTSASVNVVVNSAPTVSVTGPAGGTLFTAPAAVTINATASDSDGAISKVEFFENGVKLGEDTSAPYSFAWSSVPSGSFLLTVVATDDHGATTASAPISVTVNGAPSVSLSAPTAGTIFNAPALVSLSANASDSDGTISKVEFYQGQAKLSEDLSAPYAFDWTNVPSGSYTLTAVATDDRGATTTSTAVNVTVNGPPSVSLTSPSNNAGFAQGSSITITASASDGDGTVSKIEFYQGSTKLGQALTAPYTFPWNTPPAGSYSLTAVATDNTGATATSQAVNVNVVDFTPALLDAANRTGSDDLFSRNFNWGTGLVHLPGRAGLDLDVSLSYNSLMWLKSGSAMLYDPDHGFPTPGFRLGLPVLHGPYQNAAAGNVATYFLVTPSGGRVELRQKAGATNTYESVDSSYMRLVGTTGGFDLYPGDGSVIGFANKGGEYQCIEIKDRNGNRMTVDYNSFDRIDKITDTLGREVKFNYDSYQNPTSITQVRTVNGQAQTHVWATFGYGSMSVNSAFSGVSGLSVFGTVNRPVPVLTQVGLDDGTLYKFTYNTRGQVERVTRAAENSSGAWIDLSYVSYQMNDDGTDCPRYTQSSVWAKDWNNEEAATTTYATEGDKQTATMPDGTVEKVQYATTGWQRGLALGTETWGTVNGTNGTFGERRWTSTTWTQDDTTVSYPANPRVTESAVSDSGNSRRTVVEYLTAQESAFRLPKKVSEFKGTETTPLRYTETDYELSYDYTDIRHIIGLVKEQRLKDGAGALQSRVAYDYDTAGCVVNQTGAGRHDDNYDSTAKRGALCSVTRYKTDTTDTQNPDSIVAARMTYNSLGSPLSTTDALDHKTTTAYQDNFADGVGRNTYAYPTSATDADQNARPANETRLSATVTYDFDTGHVVRARDVKGAETVSEHDAAGRTTRITRRDGVINVDAGYTRFVYSPGQDFVESFSQVDTNVEAYSVRVMDGAGRVRATAANHPNNAENAGGYRAQIVSYDKLGQAVRQYNPTEINGSWQPAGDDATTGWAYSSQSYDWKGRPLVTTNADGTQKAASYEGCGCAGGDVATLTDEMQRRQKVYHDVLGRVVKTELLNKDASYSIYSTTTNMYNARDQVVRARAYQGAAPVPEPESEGTTYQTATSEYDGYGRLWKTKAPDQSSQIVYAYFDDDTTKSVKDARGVKTEFEYYARHLIKKVSYNTTNITSAATEKSGGAAGGTTPITTEQQVGTAPWVSYEYDAAGNRTSMTTKDNGGGGVTYAYDTLSRLTSEARTFPGLSSAYTLSYVYTIGGQLKSVTDQTAGTVFTNAFDSAGQLTGVTGTGYATTQQTFSSDMRYRAWGALKGMAYGNQTSVSLDYNQRGLPTNYAVGGIKPSATEQAQPEGGDFQYYSDGRVRFAGDLRTEASASGLHDRAYSYDHAGRLKEAYSGSEAMSLKEGAVTSTAYGAFRQSYQYDAWGDMTRRDGRVWNQNETIIEDYDGARARNAAWEYDADGRLISRNEPAPDTLPYEPLRFAYDAAGRVFRETQATAGHAPSGVVIVAHTTKENTYDGDGQVAKSVRTTQVGVNAATTTPVYYLRSSVLGGRVVSEYGAGGVRQSSYVFAGGEVVAQQSPQANGLSQLRWRHTNPVTGDAVETDSTGVVTGRTVLDPEGVDVGDTNPFTDVVDNTCDIGVVCDHSGGGGEGGSTQSAVDQMAAQLWPRSSGGSGATCIVDGLEMGCHLAQSLRAIGAAEKCPDNNCNPQMINGVLSPLTTDPSSGRLGYEYRAVVPKFRPDGSLYGAVFYEPQWIPTNSPSSIDEGFGLGGLPQNPLGAGGGTGITLNIGRRAHFDPKRFNKCLQDFFGIVAANDSPFFDRKYGGVFNGFANGDTEHSYAVTTSINRNSSALAQDLNRANNTPHHWSAQSGLTLGDDFIMGGSVVRSGLNYVASDVVADSKYGDIGVFGLYIHELGNALGVETGIDNPFGAYAEENAKHGIKDDPDVGAAFEQCVFGGIVGLSSGRVGTSREF